MAAVPNELPDADHELVSDLLDSKPDEFTDLTETQAQAFKDGALDDGNHLLIAETGNGKTFVAEAKTRKTLNNNGRVAYTVPTNALRNEKFNTLTQWLPDHVDVVNGGPYRDADVIVTTFESFFAAAIRGLVDGYELAIFDDFHVIYDSHRGPAIEKAISAAHDADMELFAMSATVGNPDVIAGWIDGRLTISDEPRSVPIDERPVEKLSSKQISIGDQVADIVETHDQKGPFLVFNGTRSRTRSRAQAIANHVEFETDTDFEAAVRDAVSTDLTDTHEEFIELLNHGIAYHHAGLDRELRDLVEAYTQSGEIQVVSATTTLSYGFNSPVQSVIVADLKRYLRNENRVGFVGVYEYVQWIGRAGRDEEQHDQAYAFPMTRDDDAHDIFQFETSVEEKTLEPANSHVQDREKLEWLALELIVHGWETDQEVMEFITHTLYWQQAVEGQAKLTTEHGFVGESLSINAIRDAVNEIITELTRKGLVTEPITQPTTDAIGYSPTAMGEAVVDYNFDNWLPNTVDSVRAFIDWLHRHHTDLSPEILVEQLAQMYYPCRIGSETGSESITNYMHSLDHSISGEAGTTAALICWGWCQGTTLNSLEQRFEIDDIAYLPGVARNVKQALDAIPVLYEPEKMPPKPDWLIPFAKRVEFGVPGADVFLLENTSYLGRQKYNNIQTQFDQLGVNDWDPGPDEPVLARLHSLYEQREQDDQLFRDFLRDVQGIGPSISANTLETVKEWDPDAGTPADLPYQLDMAVLKEAEEQSEK